MSTIGTTGPGEGARAQGARFGAHGPLRNRARASGLRGALAALALAIGAALTARAATAPAGDPPPAELQPIVGDLRLAPIQADDTLLDVAFRNRVGFTQVERLNPDTDVWLPELGTEVRLPTEAILPDAPRDGIVINIPEMRLYDFTVGPTPEVFAIAIGDLEVPTPVGDFRIRRKRANPTWYVPESVRAERPELPAAVAPGPDNPLGDYWMTLGNTTYGIHGTNIEWSIGRLATHGCIRLYNGDMERLYARIPEGTPVHIVYQTVKVGARDGVAYLEVHPDVYGAAAATTLESVRVDLVVRAATGQFDRDSLDHDEVAQAFESALGVPVPIAATPIEPTLERPLPAPAPAAPRAPAKRAPKR
jgi:L,D-transpeptidase ErfK/SrfK